MKEYKIYGKRTEYYLFEISADSEEQALNDVKHIENFGDLAAYLETFDGMEITSIEEVAE